MHDILRDFGISISSKGGHPYIVGFDKVMQKWPERSHYENCSAISFVCDSIEEHPVDLKCPKIELLQLCFADGSTELPIGIFEGLKELKVLVLEGPLLLQSLTMLRKLRTLVIYHEAKGLDENVETKIGDLLGHHGHLENLEILVFYRDSVCYDFPEEIGLLCNLRCLRFRVEFKYMPPGVLSKLVNLEELELPWKFDSWGCKEEGEGERVNASLDEIESLPLSTLKISLRDSSILAEKLVKNLTRFVVFIGRYAGISYENSNARLEVLGVDASDIEKSGLLMKCERYILKKVRNLKNIMYLQSAEDNGFPQWKWKGINIDSGREMEYLVDTITERIPSCFFSQLETLRLWNMFSLKELCPFSKIEAPFFTNLTSIDMYRCRKLKHMFPLSVARDLRQLQIIQICGCDEMEQIFYRDQVNDTNQVSSSVQLTNPTLETTSTPTSLNSNIDDKSQLICPTPNSFFRSLLGREKHLKMVSTRQMMEENIVKDDDDDAIIFPQLQTLLLEKLSKLRILYDGNDAIELPALEEFTIEECYKMETLSHGSFKAARLKQIEINEEHYPVEEDLNVIVKKKVQLILSFNFLLHCF
ncbi:disease resistance protein At4g27190-like isoform X2 [Euphorbia lathyris]|uniref:disease resistance protein At4g27190-like isoform X2 n=1 Tax=Euphorbia lathyris TaxID=212925 RepID=UPI0033132C1F